MNGIYQALDALLPFSCFRMTFMKNALIALLLLTPLLSLLGTMAVNQRMAFFSDALGHSALAGVGIGVLLGIQSELVSMLIFGVVWALLISRINRSGRSSADTTISVFSSTGIALGLLILSRDGSFSRYSSLLVGDVLAIRPDDIVFLGVALIAGLILWAMTYNKLLLTAVNKGAVENPTVSSVKLGSADFKRISAITGIRRSSRIADSVAECGDENHDGTVRMDVVSVIVGGDVIAPVHR